MTQEKHYNHKKDFEQTIISDWAKDGNPDPNAEYRKPTDNTKPNLKFLYNKKDNTVQLQAVRDFTIDKKDVEINIDKNTMGGKFVLSNDPATKKRELSDLRKVSRDPSKQTFWMDEKSSIKGKFHMPQNMIMMNTQLNSKDYNGSKDGIIVNNAVLTDSSSTGKQVIFDNSVVANSHINALADYVPHADKQPDDGMVWVRNSYANDVQTMTAPAMIHESTLNHVDNTTNSLDVQNTLLTSQGFKTHSYPNGHKLNNVAIGSRGNLYIGKDIDLPERYADKTMMLDDKEHSIGEKMTGVKDYIPNMRVLKRRIESPKLNKDMQNGKTEKSDDIEFGM